MLQLLVTLSIVLISLIIISSIVSLFVFYKMNKSINNHRRATLDKSKRIHDEYISDKEKINSDWDKVNNDFFKQFK